MALDREESWFSLSEEQRLVATEFVFSKLVEHAAESGTFQDLVFSKLGFTEDDAFPRLHNVGGMTISSEFVLSPHFVNDRELYEYSNQLETLLQPGTVEAILYKKMMVLLHHYMIQTFTQSSKIERLRQELNKRS